MKIKANRNKVILRYKKAEIEAKTNVGRFLIINVENSAGWVSETAHVESGSNAWMKEGDEIAVSYRIAHDFNQNDPLNKSFRNEYFIEKDENGDELRWCTDEDLDVYGIRRNGKIIPREGEIFCEVPPKLDEKIGLLYIPETSRKVDTENKSYKAKIRYINSKDADMLEVTVGDEIICERNSDIKKCIFGEEVICVPIKKVLAVTDGSNELGLRLLPYISMYD